MAEKKRWINVTKAVKQGVILNKWNNPASLGYYYKLIKNGKLKSRVKNNNIQITI